MADFCKQCLYEIFGHDTQDLANLCKEGFVVPALCEGCGPCMVDHTGTCVTVDCDKKHGEDHVPTD